MILSLACFFLAIPSAWTNSESSPASEVSKPIKKKKTKKKKTSSSKKKPTSKSKKKSKKSATKKSPPQKSRKTKSGRRLPKVLEDETPSLMDSLEASVPPMELAETTPEPEGSSAQEEEGAVLMEEPVSQGEDIPTPTEVLKEKEVAPVQGTDPEKAILLETPAAPTAETEKVISLEDALIGAYRQSDLLSSEYGVKAKKLQLAHAQRAWFPTTQATAGYKYDSSGTDVKNSLRQGTPFNGRMTTDSGTTNTGVGITQNLFQGGATIATILAAQKDLDASFAEYLMKEKDVLRRGIMAYSGLLVRQEVFRLCQANQKLLEETLEVNKNRYEFGELTRYDVAFAQSKLDRAKSEVINAFSEVEKAKAVLLKETGVYPTQTLKKPGFPGHLIPTSKDIAMQIAIKYSPELKRSSAYAEQAAAKVDVGVARALPSVDLSANASRSMQNAWGQSYYRGHGKTFTNDANAGANLTVPLDFFGVVQTAVRADKYEAAQRRLMALYQRRDVLSQASQAWDALEAAKAKIAQLKSEVEAAKIAVEVVREEFLAGNKTTLEVVSAEQDSFKSQVSLVEAEQGEVVAAYDLLNAIGMLTAANLSLNVESYTPDKENVPFWGFSMENDPRLAQQEILDTNMAPWEKTLNE